MPWYVIIIEYIDKNGDNEYVRYDRSKDIIYFKVNDNWVEEYNVDTSTIMDIISKLNISL